MHARVVLGASAAVLLLGSVARAADPPSTADVLGKLHHANETEIAMGKLAEKDGHSSEVKAFGKMLVKDHTAADKKVGALAKQEKIDLGNMPAMPEMAQPEPGPGFDDKFAQMMLEAHKKDIAALTTARDTTSDDKLKKLLTAVLPTLQKHEDTAQKILDAQVKNPHT